MPVALKDAYLFSNLDEEKLIRVRAMAQETRLVDGQTLFLGSSLVGRAIHDCLRWRRLNIASLR